jgi:hypothetical protein
LPACMTLSMSPFVTASTSDCVFAPLLLKYTICQDATPAELNQSVYQQGIGVHCKPTLDKGDSGIGETLKHFILRGLRNEDGKMVRDRQHKSVGKRQTLYAVLAVSAFF